MESPHFLHVMGNSMFVPALQRMFEGAGFGHHEYVIVRGSSRGAEPIAPARFAASIEEAVDIVASSDARGLVLNGLDTLGMERVADAAGGSMRRAWYVWGYESWDRPIQLRRSLILPQTLRVLHDAGLAPAEMGTLHTTKQRLKEWVFPPFNRFDYCVSQLPSEYRLLKAHRLFSRTRYQWGAVGALDDYVPIDAPVRPVGSDIQLGNSASFSMNHIDAIRVLAQSDLGDRRVIVPLSYGDTAYRDLVISEGKRLLGDRIVPLVDFVPLATYEALLAECGVVVMNQMRQQALGNIVSALWRGATVYMQDTPVYRDYGAAGMDVRLIENLDSDLRLGEPRKSDADVVKARELLVQYLGRERVLQATRTLLSRLASDR